MGAIKLGKKYGKSLEVDIKVEPKVDPEVGETVEMLRRHSFLALLPDQLVSLLVPSGHIETMSCGTQILSQGKMNSIIFFLIEGQVEVRVDGETVVVLDRLGDVLGEMSLISEVPSSATVNCLKASKFLIFEHEAIRELAERDGGIYGRTLFQVFAKVLTGKLKNTNEKARRFEVANKELKKIHKEMEEIVQRRLEELANNKNISSQLISDLYHKDLASLCEDLKSAHSSADHLLDPGELLQIHDKVEKTRAQLKPLAEAYSSEKALENKKVLLAEEDRKQQRITKMALRGTGLSLDMVSSLDEAAACLDQNEYDILMVSPGLVEVSELAYKKNPSMHLVLMTSESVSTYIQSLKEHPFLTNIVSRNEEDRTFTVKNIFTTVGKLATDDIFGMSKYLSWGIEIQSEVICGSRHRPQLLDVMTEQFGQFGIRAGVIERCRLVAEEMLMNAIYDAPVDAAGAAKYNHLQRVEQVELKIEERATFRFACDGIVAAISVTDPFGALKKDTLVKYLESCYAGATGDEREFHRGKGGGGMGTHLMVETSDLMVFNIHEGVRTEVIALFNVDKKTADQLKNPSFHLFYKKS